MKIIQISSASSSFSVKDYGEDIFKVWSAKVGFELKKAYPKLDIECWTPEKECKQEKEIMKNGIKFKIFPTELSVRHGMEICFGMIRALKKEMKKDKNLILHFHEYHSWITYLLLFFAGNKVKIICQHHGGRSPMNNLFKYKKLLIFLPAIFLMQFAENLLFKKVGIFYALTDEEINYLKKKNSGKIKFQTMGISDEYFKKQEKIEIRKKLNLDNNKKYGIYLGRIKTTKGIKELLDAVKALKDRNFELLLIGGGVDSEKYKDYANKNKIENAKFLGNIYGNKKRDYLSAGDFLILPSYTEGAPVVLMEAIAENLPVIATNVGGIRKMIENYREGIIINPQSKEEIINAIKEILKWKNKNIRKYAEKYRWEKIIKNTMEDYNKKC